MAQSSGFKDPGFRGAGSNTYIVSNGQEIRIDQGWAARRGHQVFVLNERTGEVVDKTAFDTWSGGDGAAAARQMTTFLEGVAQGRIIAIVVQDTGDTRVNLAPYGSTITQLGPRESYAMITQKGATPSWFVEQKSAQGAGPTIVETTIPAG
ncbi:protein O-linked-mannose beta-1,2-N-acetylglucosaminyltransferase 1-like [Branchiostoma lanceolatum]|uniref:protein O-linked-mannose beta-1,2-N-acetylglucosaminyltransferase 1-like n=1 Tax=Branchiostoma lanceolatum TaxID=7740 RepID=UPI0034547739